MDASGCMDAFVHEGWMHGRMHEWMDGRKEVCSVDVSTHGCMRGCMEACLNGIEWMDGWMDGRKDGWMDGWLDDGWMDGRVDPSRDRSVHDLKSKIEAYPGRGI